MKAIILVQSEFNELNARVQQYCIKTIKGYNAIKWANELIHKDGRIALCVEDKILPALTDSEKNTIIELGSDWFPTTGI